MVSDDGYSFLVSVLPYMEESAFYEELMAASRGFTEPLDSARFQQARPGESLGDRDVELIVCPSYPGEGLATGKYPSVARPQVSNYLAMVAACVEGEDQTFADKDPKTGGMLVTKQTSPQGLTIQDATDGTSKILFLTESKEETWAAWFSGSSTATVAFSPDVTRYSTSLKTPKQRRDVPLGINYGSSDGSQWFWARRPDQRAWGPSSAHAGDVVMSGFVDGHVKPLNVGIGANVYFQLVARGDGERLESDL